MLIRPLSGLLLVCAAALASAHADVPRYVSRHAAKILPHRLLMLSCPEDGEITFHSFGQGRIAKGTLLATINDELLAIQEREMEIVIRKRRIEHDEAVQKLRKSREEVEYLQGLPPQKRGFAQSQLKIQVDADALALLDSKIAVLEDTLRLSEDKLRQAARKKREACTLRMPFDGRLQYHLPLPEKEGESLPLPSSVPVATVIDDSCFYLVFAATNPALSKLESSRLRISIDLGGGDILEADWHHSRVEKGEREETLFYYFLLPEQYNERAFSLLGAHLVAELAYLCPESWLYISKIDLALEAGESPIESWEKFIDTHRPGYKLVFVGETHLCLRKDDECKAAALPAS